MQNFWDALDKADTFVVLDSYLNSKAIVLVICLVILLLLIKWREK